MNDLISRSELLAQLENHKITAADVVVRVIIDYVIRIVKAQPAVEVTP